MKQNTFFIFAVAALVFGAVFSVGRVFAAPPPGLSRALIAADERIPWWKGGLWRNNNGDEGGDDEDGGDDSSGSGDDEYSDSSPSLDDDDMWADESEDEYSGYNRDGSFGRQAETPAPAGSDFGGDPYANDPYAATDPYASPAQNPNAYAADPYAAPYAAQPPMTQGGVYTDPNYAAPYSAPYSDPYATTDPYAAVDPYAAQPYTTQPAYDAQMYAPPPPGGAGVGGADPFASAPPSYQAAPSVDAQGSPQFENAVRLVKDNRFSEAKGILASETARNPSNVSAWRWLADCHYNLLELDEAINGYQRALELDPNDYYALRGQGFSYLHRGHEYWRRMQEQVGRGEKEAAAATFAQAHDSYKKSLELLGLCLRRAPNDGETIYGEAMAAEGASRKLYSNAISYLKLGPEQRERAELFAENCVTVINKGVERSKERAKQNPGDAGPRALLGGLYLRKAILFHQLGRNDQALIELRNSRDVQSSILDEIDKNNLTAQRNLREADAYWEEWGGNRQ